MAELEEFKDKQLKYFWYVILYVSLFALIFFIFYGLKTINEEECSVYEKNNLLGLNTYTLSDSNTLSFPVNMPKNKNQNIGSRSYCLEITGSTSDYNTLTAGDGSEQYVNNATTGLTCFSNVDYNDNGYTSLECNNCDETNNVSISLAKETVILKHNTVFSSENVYYKFFNSEYCKEIYKDFVKYYFLILGFILLFFLGQRGINWLQGFLYKGW